MKPWLARIKAALSHRSVQLALVLVLLAGVLIPTQMANACGVTDPIACIQSFVAWIAGLIIAVLNGLIVLLIEALIPVMLYNNFTSAPVVVQGWALVRDTVNMFFVIVLIVLAFGTIFGHQKFGKYQLIPRILIFAIVINFSKTLAGVMIDFGQIVMLTFANALAEIAAGNFVEMFGLTKVVSLAGNEAGNAVQGWDLTLASLMGVFVLLWVTMILLMMFAILIYRIVGLWVLIVVAPLAWFAGGAGDLVSSGAYAEWWSKFKCLVAIGPVITFFLWLALAVAGAGAADGFNTAEAGLSGSSSGFVTSIFELQSFLSLVVGSALLLAGMQQAQSICSSMGGLNPLTIGKGALNFGRGVTQRVAGYGARKLGGAARVAGRKVGRYGGAAMAKVPVLKYATKQGREQMWRGMAKASGTGVVGKTLGRFAEKRAGAAAGVRAEQIARAGERYKDDSMGMKVSQLKRFADSKAKTLGGKDEAKSLFKEMMGNADMRKKFEEEGGDVKSLWRNYGGEMEKDYAGDDVATDKIKDFKKRYAHLTGSTADIKTKEDVENLSEEALADKDVRDRLAGLEVEVQVGNKKQRLTAFDAISQGRMGDKDQREALAGGYESFDDDQLRVADAGSLVNSAQSSTVERTTQLALDEGKAGRVDEIVNKLLDRYKDTRTSDADRFKLATAMDRLTAQLAAKIDAGGLAGSYQKQLRGLQQSMQESRVRTENTVAGPSSSTSLKFGAIPPSAQIADAGQFVNTNFAGASQERKTEAKAQVNGRINDANEEVYKKSRAVADLVQQQKGKLSAEGERLIQETTALWAAFREARKASEDSAKQEAQALTEQAKGKDRDLSSKQKEFDRAASRGADIGELGRLRDEKTALEREKAALENQANGRLAAVDQDVLVVDIRQQIEVKQKEYWDTRQRQGGIQTNDLEGTKPFLDAIEQAEQERDRLREILVELERLSPPTM